MDLSELRFLRRLGMWTAIGGLAVAGSLWSIGELWPSTMRTNISAGLVFLLSLFAAAVGAVIMLLSLVAAAVQRRRGREVPEHR
ncbi:hypothetical protein [Nakamurella endophytica]|uniref:Uncharacterized protein n=1 Tax=Nakamurella endophytica TaxID=1748367 RepID=A0A917SRT9_9ACTN|nr:hypothetical protein [Nakamurella endophytica]GGL94410.1 hypothetical protein GCM10011594_12780 [Nakamurella endophytica]